jgi:recombinational DNA repair protein (RecF pathway)
MHYCNDTTHAREDCGGEVRQCAECGGFACEFSISFERGHWLCAHCRLDADLEAEYEVRALLA